MSAPDREAERRALQLFEHAADHPHARTALAADEPTGVRAALARLNDADRRARHAFPTADDAPVTAQPRRLPKIVGNYRLGQVIGEGGMGLVFAGERADGLFEHQVAIKLIHPHIFGVQAAERFARERKLLARLDHPHIARLIDGGVCEDGWPYIIMERIDGLPLDAHTAEHALGLRARVTLLLQICGAVQAAHAALVVHGDIKPANVLVRHDGSPRLLDFGVARLADGEELPGLQPRTAAFCAPERLAGAPPTVGGDIFALGTLVRLICGTEDRDLAAIAARANADRPQDRYASAEALRLDLGRWLDGLPVSARAANPGYVIGRFVRRHRATTLIALALLLGLLLALAYATVGWRRAAARAADLGSLAEYQLTSLDRRLDALPRTVALRTDLARETQIYLDRLARSEEATAAMRRRAADGLRRLALLQGAADRPSLGDPAAAARSFERALAALPADRDEVTRRLRVAILIDAAHAAAGAADPIQAGRLLDQVDATAASPEALARYWLGRSEVAQWNGRFPDAVTASRNARAVIARLLPQREARLLLTESFDLEADAFYYAHNLAHAVRLYRIAERLATENERRWPDDRRARWRAARERWSLGTALVEAGQASQALPLLRTAFASAEADALADPADHVTGRRYRIFMLSLGQAMARAGDIAAGLALLRQSVEQRQAWWRAEPRDAARRRDWTTGVAALGDALTEAGQVAPACQLYRRARRSIAVLIAEGRLTPLDEGAGARDLERQWASHCE